MQFKFKCGDKVTHCNYMNSAIGEIVSSAVINRNGLFSQIYDIQFKDFKLVDCPAKNLTLVPTKPKFKVGDPVRHIGYALNGEVVADISNEYAEGYDVKFPNCTRSCSADFLYKLDREDKTIMKSGNAKLTKEQFKAVQYLERDILPVSSKEEIIITHIKSPHKWHGATSEINRMKPDILIRALYVGYEQTLTKEEQVGEILSEYYTTRTAPLMHKVIDAIKKVYEGDK